MYKVEDGILDAAEWIASPNFGKRPANQTINLLVIHNISLPPDQFGGGHIEKFFLNKLEPDVHPYFKTIHDLQVSAHLLIERTGRVIQFVNLNDRAWHAGLSCFKEQGNCNDFSIGIELEGTDTREYTDKQYQQLTAVSLAILEAYPDMTLDRIVGHSDIAPGRKTDPGESFDWSRYRRDLQGYRG